MRKTTLFFDCFGVVAERVLGKWVPDNLGPDFNIENLFDKHDLGQIQEQELLEYLSGLVQRNPQLVRKEIDDCFKINIPVADLIKQLRTNGYQVVLLTNSNHSFFERYVFVQYPDFKNLFDDIIISSKIKMIKPNKDIFLYALSKTSVTPEESIFIDDTERHVLAARSIGIDSIVYRTSDQLKNDLAYLGVVL